MPYKRYDITNSYSSRGKRRNENTALKTVFLIVIPFLIVGVILGGAYISYRLIINENYEEPITPVATADSAILYEEELLAVVNESNALDSSYVPELSKVEGVYVSALAEDDLNNMIAAANADGVNLNLKAGYVSFEEQQTLYEQTFEKIKKKGNLSQIKAEAETKKVCPKAGCSESQTGLLVEFDATEGSNAYKWLQKYSVNFGFILRYPESKETETGMTYNPNLYRYVGKDSAANIRRYDMSLEEYATHISIR